MLHCANPDCKREVQYFREGRLYMMDDPQKDSHCVAHGARKIVWLCRECSVQMSVEDWRPAGEQLQRHTPASPVVRRPQWLLTV